MQYTNRFDRLKGTFRNVGVSSQKKMEEFARDFARKFFIEVKKTQPVGQLEPEDFAAAAGRDPRPSVRMGNQPIAKSWLDSPVVTRESPNVMLITLRSNAPHLHYFTRWTGRDHLGTRGGRPIVAMNKKTLAFWWKGQTRFPKAITRHEGFQPRSDFMQVAWMRMQDDIRRARRDFVKIAIVDPLVRDLA